MYLTTVIFKRSENSNWEPGWYLGNTDNSDKSTIMDSNYSALTGEEIWDVKDTWDVRMTCPEPSNKG